ncbi:hypothetical protein V5O48_003672 [Marasmius crinis-equi]|uniref:Uncharacterized protein n=1 Tax=Marasmius crinis-equi TaxID=585013 RepID=A0ABR3FS92_9AGAR
MTPESFPREDYSPSTVRQTAQTLQAPHRRTNQIGLGVFGSTPPPPRPNSSFAHQNSSQLRTTQSSFSDTTSTTFNSQAQYPHHHTSHFEDQDNGYGVNSLLSDLEEDDPLQNKSLVDPLALASDLAGVLELDESHQEMLMTYIATNKGLDHGLLNSQIVIHANQLQQSMTMSKILKKLENHDEILTKMKSKIQDNPQLSKDQSASRCLPIYLASIADYCHSQKEVLSWAKKVVIKDNRLDFDNDALIAGKLLGNVPNSILKDYLNINASQAEKDALDSEIRTQGSNAKALLRNVIMESLTEGHKARASLTQTTRVAARKFLGASDLATPSLTVRILLLVSEPSSPDLVPNFSQLEASICPGKPPPYHKGGRTPSGAARPTKRPRAATGDSSATSPAATNELEEDDDPTSSDVSLVMSFAAWLRQKYEDKTNWGEKFNEKKWVEYCNHAIDAEKKDWPSDPLTILPLKVMKDHGTGDRTHGTSMQSSGNTPYSNTVAGPPTQQGPSTSGYAAHRQPTQGVSGQSGSPYAMIHREGPQ